MPLTLCLLDIILFTPVFFSHPYKQLTRILLPPDLVYIDLRIF